MFFHIDYMLKWQYFGYIGLDKIYHFSWTLSGSQRPFHQKAKTLAPKPQLFFLELPTAGSSSRANRQVDGEKKKSTVIPSTL